MLCLGAALFFTGSQVSVSRAEVTSESIKEKQNQISAAEDEKKKLQQGLTDIKKIKEELEKSKDNLADYIVQLDSNLNIVNDKIAELQKTIEQKTLDIETTTQELNIALQTEQNQYEAMKVRIQFMYERGDAFYLEAFFGAESFGDILNRADYSIL